MNHVSLHDADYPERLRDIYDPPSRLYYIGSLPKKDKKTVAIVGARACSAYGKAVATYLGKRLAAAGIEIISGLAYGVDCAAQSGALQENGNTYAVMGCGADICYPCANRCLYEKICQSGGILSEYPPGTTPKPYFFPQRNRLISGLADAVIVVEAKARSGSLITADFALEQGKDVYAVPGRMGDGLSSGTNRLISQGAGILYSVDEFLKDMEIEPPEEASIKFPKITLEKNDKVVYAVLDFYPKDLDWLMEQTGLGIGEIGQSLHRLARQGCIEETYKNQYIRAIVL